jgi:hypothetical protein
LDRIVVERNESGLVRRCVECGDREVLDANATPTRHADSRGRIIARSSTDER